VISLPFSQKAREEVGLEIIANVIALAAISQITGVVSRQALEKSLMSRIPKGTEEKNRQAMEIGFALGREARK
jgi:2-oxoglutarate ferredoxin oxidoreductase subunit gamma